MEIIQLDNVFSAAHKVRTLSLIRHLTYVLKFVLQESMLMKIQGFVLHQQTVLED